MLPDLYIYYTCTCTCSSTMRVFDQAPKTIPCFTADVILSLPNIVSYTSAVILVYTGQICIYLSLCLLTLKVIQPSLEDIQNAVNSAVQCITDVGQYVDQWMIPSPASSLSNTPRSNDSKIDCILFIYMFLNVHTCMPFFISSQ